MNNKKICYSEYQDTKFPVNISCGKSCTDTATGGDYYQNSITNQYPYLPYFIVGIFIFFILLILISRPSRMFMGRRGGRPMFRRRFGGGRRGGIMLF